MEIVKFVTDLNDAYKKRRVEWEALQTALASNAQETRTVQAKRVISEEQKAAMYPTGKLPAGFITERQRRAELERLADREADLREQLSALQDSASGEFQSIRDNMAAELAAALSANPADVDGNGYSLIASHSLGDSDLVALSRNYAGNPTMLKLIQAEAATRKGGEMTALAVNISEFLSPDRRLDQFDRAVEEVTRGLNPNAAFGNINHDYWQSKGLSRIQGEIGGADTLQG